MSNTTEAIAVAEKFLHKDFAHVPLNVAVDPHDTLQEMPDLNLWKQVEIKDYQIIAPFVSIGQMTLEVSVDFMNPQMSNKLLYMLIDMEQGNAFCLYKGIQDELRQAMFVTK